MSSSLSSLVYCFVPSIASHYCNTLLPSRAYKSQLHLSLSLSKRVQSLHSISHFSTSPQMSSICQIKFTESPYWMNELISQIMNECRVNLSNLLVLHVLRLNTQWISFERNLTIDLPPNQSEFQLKLFWNVMRLSLCLWSIYYLTFPTWNCAN